ncbi:hypothetical protein [Hyphomicrobium sp. 2TAF46]|uniref:hypothetical protein n=1 Tax=Hyphomicrobium sp. 2TAF46 TaxID=3233019 RepID=UPI003F8DFBE4
MNYRARLRVIRRRFRPLRPKGRLLLYIVRNWWRPPKEVFRGAWKIVDEATAGTSVRRNFRKMPVRHIQHYNLRQVIKSVYPDFVPQISIDPNVIDALRTGPSVIATIHSRSEYAICAALDRAGLASAVITAGRMNPVDVDNYGFGTAPKCIQRDRNVFLEMRVALKDSCTIVCDVDYVLDKHGPAPALYVSASLFAFQQAVKAKLYFGYTNISDDGQIECVVVPAGGEGISPEDTAREFIEFIDRMQGTKLGLRIGTWRPESC